MAAAAAATAAAAAVRSTILPRRDIWPDIFRRGA